MKQYTDIFPEKGAFCALLHEAFEKNGLASLLSREAEDRFYLFALLLREENLKYNLTAVTDAVGIAYLHFADSAFLAPDLSLGASLLDVGSGAGFPALPIAILRPDLSVTALDSTGKRVEFIRMVSERLSLNNISAVCSRAEDYSGGKARERFDYVTARAVAPLDILSELCIPAVCVGGSFISLKSDRAETELSGSEAALKRLGASLDRVVRYELAAPDGPAKRTRVVVRKFRSTPLDFPRPYNTIKKKPLF